MFLLLVAGQAEWVEWGEQFQVVQPVVEVPVVEVVWAVEMRWLAIRHLRT
jgi:hypothetical protein